MNARRIWLWIALAAIAAGIFIGIRHGDAGHPGKVASQPTASASVKQGEKAPQFATATNQGYFDLSAANKPVFVEVFATWCPHCQRETAVIDRLYARYKSRVQFVGLPGSNSGMDGRSPSSQQDVANFISAFNVQYPIALYDPSLQTAREYLQGGFPTMAVIGRDKTIAYLTSGETSYAELEAALKKVL